MPDHTQNLKWQLLLRLGIPTIFVIWAAYYFISNPQLLHEFESIAPLFIIALIVTQLFSIYLTSFYTSLMAKPFGVDMTTWEAVQITVIARGANMIFPMKAGAGIRAYYLSKRHGLALTDFMAIFAGQTLLSTLLACIVGLGGITFIFIETGQTDPIGLSFLLITVIVIAGFLFISPDLPENRWKLLRFINGPLQSWYRIKRNRRLLYQVSIISVLNTLLSAMMIWFSFSAIGAKANLGASLYLGGIQDLGYLVSLTPGSLGIVEGATIFLGSQLGINLTQIVTVAVLARLAIFLTSVVLAPICSWTLFGKSWIKEIQQGRGYRPNG